MTDNQEEKITTDQYGRKKWNVEAYAKEAKTKTKSVEKSIVPQIEDDSSSLEYITQRNKLLDQSLNAVKKYNLISPQSTTSTFGKNKRFGFFCPICDVSFRDNLLLIDHLNSPQHVSKLNQLNTGKDSQSQELLEGGIRRATLKEVVTTMEKLIAKSIQVKNDITNTPSGLSFQERVERRKEFEEKKKQKRIERKQTQKQRKRQKVQQTTNNNEVNDIMGFGNFGSTKS